jgi:hypothetical protein
MIPRLGQKYEIEIDNISKPKAAYQTEEYFELDLSVAPVNILKGPYQEVWPNRLENTL